MIAVRRSPTPPVQSVSVVGGLDLPEANNEPRQLPWSFNCGKALHSRTFVMGRYTL